MTETFALEPASSREHGLPEGWVLARVGDILGLVNGFAFKPSHWKGHGLPIIRIQNLNTPDAPFNYCPDVMPTKYIVNNGDLLFAWSGTPGTSFGAHVWGGAKGLLNQHIFRVEFNGNLLDKRFLRLAINRNLDDYIAEAHGGVGLAHITKSKFDDSFLALPPLPEQKRIVSATEKCEGRIDAARDHLSRGPAILKRFRQAVLAAACSGKLTEDWRQRNTELESAEALYERAQVLRAKRYEELVAKAISHGKRKPNDPRKSERSNKPVIELPDFPRNWRVCPLQDLSYLITDGTHRTPTYQEKGVAFLSVKNVRPFAVVDDEVKRISEVEHREITSRCNPEIGDILYTKVGTFGYAAANRLSYPFSLFVSVALIKPVSECFTTDYAEIVLNSDIIYAQAADRVSGSGVPDLHLVEIRDFRIPLPPLQEQHEIVNRVRGLLEVTDGIERRLSEAVAKADKLTQSILAKAFRGELVPTEAELARREGRDYEPASVLLERIKKQREAETSSKNSKPKRTKKVSLAAAKG